MDRLEKTINIAGAVLFGSIGITALVAATFFGARHQFAIAALCAMMVWAFITEIRCENRKTGIKPTYVAYGAFLSTDRRGEFKNLSALLKPPTMKPYVAVAFREEDGERLPAKLPAPAFEPRDIDLQFAIVATSAAEFMQRYTAFVEMLRGGWLDIRVAGLPKTFRVYYKSSTDFGQLAPLGGGAVAGKFKVKFREPKPAI